MNNLALRSRHCWSQQSSGKACGSQGGSDALAGVGWDLEGEERIINLFSSRNWKHCL